jgi:hypothetical protein
LLKTLLKLVVGYAAIIAAVDFLVFVTLTFLAQY